MADISQEVTTITNSPYGEQIRTAIIGAVSEINDEADAVDELKDILTTKTWHSCFYRGKLLGTGTTFEEASTEAQRAAIADGTFADLYIGDYWNIDNKIFRIADFNYFYNIGDTNFATNHIVIVPDNGLLNAKMNTENITTGAYTGSEFYTSAEGGLAQAKSIVNTLFGSYVASHRIYLANAVSASGAESAGAWFDSTVDLMNEIMVYGSKIRSTANDNTHLYTTEKTQLALFRLNPKMINRRISYWLRDVVSATSFAYVDGSGYAGYYNASYSTAVRPFFVIKGTK